MTDLLDTIFRTARTPRRWTDTPLPEGKLEELWELMKFAPTSANTQPLRVVFVTSEVGRERLANVAMGSNQAAIKAAPATAILAWDTRFHEYMGRFFPHDPNLGALFAENEDLGHTTAFRNSTLQGAYFMLAARAVGLDCGPMSGFDNQALDQAFFPDGRFQSNFICVLGTGSSDGLHDRAERFDFHEVCTFA